MSVCFGNEWQVGHIGFSDRNHKYWILCLIIAKSENHTAAGELLNRATTLLRSVNADAKYVLVDGGKALDKAIGIANESRQKNVLTSVAECTSDEFDTFLHSEAHTAVNPPKVEGSADDYVISYTLDNMMEEIVEAFAGQGDSDAGDQLGRSNLEERIRGLLHSFRLGKERCHAHITRNAGSRGGGWRGGKGSLCRALLSSGCSKKNMQKVSAINSKHESMICRNSD